MRRSGLLFLTLSLAGCGGTDDAADASAAAGGALTPDAARDAAAGGTQAPDAGLDAISGTVTLRFAVGQDLRDNQFLTDMLRGDILGDVFRAEEVSLMGPRDDAEVMDSLRLDAVDLTAGVEALSPPHTLVPLPPGEYMFLGMFDLDGNAAESGNSPDAGDPVTFPIARFVGFTVVAGQATDATITFTLLYN